MSDEAPITDNSQAPLSTLIEETAIELAAEVYHNYRKYWNMTEKARKEHPNIPDERTYIRNNYERMIPKATELLLQILHTSNSEAQKKEIYDAFIERANWKPKINGVVADVDFGRPN